MKDSLLTVLGQATPTPVPDPPPSDAGTILQKLIYQIPGWPVDNALFSFLLTLIVWTGIAVLAYWLLFHLFRRLVGQTRTDADNIVLRTVRVPLFIAIVAYGLVTAISELGLRPNIGFVVGRLYTIVLIAVGFYLAWRIVKEVILRWLTRHSAETEIKIDDLLVPLINTVGPFLFFMVALVLVLQYSGVDVGLLAASIGVVGLVVGLAFQDTLSNLFSGIYLILDPAFREHDLIILPDDKIYGVERVGLRMTQLYDMSNHALIYTPNSELTKATIANITRPTVDMKVALSMQAAYGSDPQHVAHVLRDILQSHPNILGEPADKVSVLNRRIEQLSTLAGDAGKVLARVVADLDTWHRSRTGEDPELHASLLAVRKEMNVRLADAETAARQLPERGDSKKPVAALRQLLSGDLDEEPEGMDHGRISLINNTLARVESQLSAAELQPLKVAIGAVEELDRQENSLEAELAAQEQQEDSDLQGQLSALERAAENAALTLNEQGFQKEAASVQRWARTAAVLHAELAVDDSLAAMDREIDGLIGWLRDLEAGGVTRAERARIRAAFGQWGGIQMMEKRRVAELQRRILRWFELKEKGVLPPSEYATQRLIWERKLRLLSRRLRETRGDDEESLDTRLTVIKQWMHSVNFWDSLQDWKLPGAGFKEFGEYALGFGLAFYIDDIKLEHFSRRSRVVGELLLDIHDTFAREKIGIPIDKHDPWISAGPPKLPPTGTNGSNPDAQSLPLEAAGERHVPYTHDFEGEGK
ncbi:MAG TPA: mechanosensitive ion channel domain-containing protein [Chloroflexia bacterium]|nr:mechanosensitive ion channel domain-containing protein [Chloroflexia bacterium]